MSYLGLSRKYRPQRLAVTGRVYPADDETPFEVETRPFHGNVLITVRANGEERMHSLAGTENLDDPRIEQIAPELYQQILRI